MSVIRKKRKLCQYEHQDQIKTSIYHSYPIQELLMYLDQSLRHIKKIIVHTNDGDLDMLQLFMTDYTVEMYSNQNDSASIGFFYKKIDNHSCDYCIVSHPNVDSLETLQYRIVKHFYCILDKYNMNYVLFTLLQK
jgi:hypothetical protein